jgi:hypothetical protein
VVTSVVLGSIRRARMSLVSMERGLGKVYGT